VSRISWVFSALYVAIRQILTNYGWSSKLWAGRPPSTIEPQAPHFDWRLKKDSLPSDFSVNQHIVSIWGTASWSSIMHGFKNVPYPQLNVTCKCIPADMSGVGLWFVSRRFGKTADVSAKGLGLVWVSVLLNAVTKANGGRKQWRGPVSPSGTRRSSTLTSIAGISATTCWSWRYGINPGHRTRTAPLWERYHTRTHTRTRTPLHTHF